jgi:peptidoglycan/xylan/chitin deacetylase (PgdA/CDA1 family)
MQIVRRLTDWDEEIQWAVPILMFHKIGLSPPRTKFPWLYFSSGGFCKMMGALMRDGFQTVSMDHALRGQKPGSPRFVISFDDGFESALKYAAECLREHKFIAIQFLVADFLGRRNEWDLGQRIGIEPVMDQKQVMEWLSLGHEIGAHTLTHPRLTQIPLSRAQEEIHSSKKKLEDLFGVPVRHFAYPYGDRNQEIAAIVQQAGFHTGCTADSGCVRLGDDAFQLRRVTARERTFLIWAALRLQKSFRLLVNDLLGPGARNPGALSRGPRG